MRGWLPVILITAALALSGCGEEQSVETDVTEAQLNDDIQTTVEPDENQSEQTEKLTFDDVNIIEINGKQVSLPFTVDELGEEYSIGEEYGSNEIYTALYYKNEFIAFININNEKEITSISFPSETLENNIIKIYNLSSSDSFEKIIDTIGIPNVQTEIALLYKFDFGELYFCSENMSQGSLGFNFVKISINGGL